jgi:superfamily II DNA or RNA helicase
MKFGKEHFDYIIIDEVHKAGADSYKKVIEYFAPKFLLGMTATPERTDGFNIYELFDYNIAYEIRLQKALEEDMLCPFHYFGVSEIEVDGQILDDKSDFRKLTSEERVKNIIEKAEFYGHSGSRVKGLIFCSRNEEAKELSRMFNNNGYDTIALSGESSQEEREQAISRLEQENLENKLDYIFTRDIFNEGVDIPQINQIIMLRPTESSVIFVQQLGRGLRKSRDKEFVVIIDFIGNYQKNFLIPIALSGDKTFNKDTIRKFVIEGNSVIPGCSTIIFDEVAQKRIFDSINTTNFSTIKLLKEEYNKLKIKIGKIPSLVDFYEHGSIDPQLIISHSKSYYNFLIKIEKEYLIRLDIKQQKAIEFISNELSNGKRPHELILLKELLYRESITKEELNNIFNEYDVTIDEKSLNSAISILSNGFLTITDLNKYNNANFLILEEKCILRSIFFNNCLDDKFIKLITDLLEYSFMEFYDNYSKPYRDTNLNLYQKYSRKDACKLLNWEKDESSVVYGYKIKHNSCPIFVTYNKNNDIVESIKYEDKFIDRNTFSWMSKNNRTIQSPDVNNILHHQEKNIRIDLFVKKADADGTDFYYLGELDYIESIQTEIKNDDNKVLPIVNIKFKFKNAVREDIYDYLTK